MIKLTEPLVFITGNLHKVHWTQKYIHVPLEHKKLDLLEIQSLDVKEVVEHKVKEAYKILQKPVLVEDTSLVFHALGKLPGPYIKWFLEELGNEGLCDLLRADRAATVSITFGIYDGKDLHFGEGTAKGTIAEKPRGNKGFGWDSIFIPEGKTQTYAELSDEEMAKISPRVIAVEKLKKII